MPYIKPEDKPQFEDSIQTLANKLRNPGDINYVITKLVQLYVKNKGLKYENLNQVVGALECCKLELYRRLIGPYEDTKIVENGDVCEVNCQEKGKSY